MKANTKNIPALRFTEFKDEWKSLYFNDVFTSLESGVSVNANAESINLEQVNEFGILKTSCVSAGKFIPNENKRILDEEVKRAKLNPRADTILISRMNTPALVGESGYVSKDYGNLFIPDRLWLANAKKDYSARFVSIVLSSSKMMSVISGIATGTSNSMKNISKPNFLNLNTLFPSLPEQQKIADFLTAVDERIQQLSKKKQLLEQYKKGVMQQLFSQQLRFKDEKGNNYPDWEEYPLQKLAKKVTLKNKDNNISTVLTNSATKGIVSQADYFDNDVANANNLSGYYVVELNDFVYNPRISTTAPVGPIKRNKLIKGLMSPLYTVFRMTDINLDFVEQYFNTNLWHDYMKSVANYGARHDRMSIGINDFMNLPIPYPCIDEQIKIVTFINSLDQKINSANLELEKTQAFKKGLLQQMFV